MLKGRGWELHMASFLTLGLILHHGNIWEMRAKGTDLHHRFLMTTLLPQYTAVVYVALLYFLQFGIMLLFSVKEATPISGFVRVDVCILCQKLLRDVT